MPSEFLVVARRAQVARPFQARRTSRKGIPQGLTGSDHLAQYDNKAGAAHPQPSGQVEETTITVLPCPEGEIYYEEFVEVVHDWRGPAHMEKQPIPVMDFVARHTPA
jgi:hypothetical protein